MKSWIIWTIGIVAILSALYFVELNQSGLTLFPNPSHNSESEQSATSTSSADDQSEREPSASNQSDRASNSSDSSMSTAVIVNGERLSKSKLDSAFVKLMQRYKERYVQRGTSLKETLKGPSGAYLELQIRYQAAQSLIEKTLIVQKANARGLQINESTLKERVKKRYSDFLQDNGVTEDQLRSLLNHPQKRVIAQRLLGIKDSSAEEFKNRLKREVRYRILKRKLVRDITKANVDPESEKANETLDKWLKQAKESSKITYEQLLLAAYHEEQKLNDIDNLRAKLDQVKKTISAYKQARAQTSSDHIDYFLGQLYNLQVNWSSAIKRRIVNKPGSSRGNSDESTDATNEARQVSSLEQTIEESRKQATQFLKPYNVQNERQLRKMLQADQQNPLYKYMYAKLLLNKDNPQTRKAMRMLGRAIDINDRYVDAYVLFGDIRLDQGNYRAAVKRYKQSLDVYSSEVQPQFRSVARARIKHKLAQAKLEYARGLASDGPPQNDDSKRSQALKDAKQLLRELKKRMNNQAPKYARVLADLGEVAMLEGQYSEAQRHFKSSLDVQDRVSTQVRLGDAYRQAERWNKAEATYRDVLQQKPNYAPAHKALAMLYRAQGNTEKAVNHYRTAFVNGQKLTYSERRSIALDLLEVQPGNVTMRLRLGQFYLKRRIYDGAMETFRTVLDQQSDSVQARVGIGRIHFGRAQYKQALSTFRNALDVASTSQERIQIYEWILKAEQRVVGPGQSLTKSGQRAMWKLAQLYADTGQQSQSFQTLRDLREGYPNFRPKEVKQRIEEIKSADSRDHRPGQDTPDQGASIIEPGEDHVAYATIPPTSGPHYVIPADWGLHAEPIPDEVQLRNLAGGGVMIQYQLSLDDATQKKLRQLVQSLRQQEETCRIVLAPYEGLDAPITLTAWTRMAKLETFEEEQIRLFVDAFIGTGPEVDQVGCMPLESSGS